jgi:UDP-2,3-diacylglucosamine hydrolase
MIRQLEDINTAEKKKVFFASDFHLGTPADQPSLVREKKVVSWLRNIKSEAQHIFILGDIFDFWFEYEYTIPKGFTRLQGTLMELRDEGIPITFFSGNHDIWMFHYFQDEFDIPVYRDPAIVNINDKKFLIGHGDGLGPGDRKYKFFKKLFENPISQWMFKWIHPDIAFRIANRYSKKSRLKNLQKDQEFKGDHEWLFQYCKDVEENQHHDYYIFGHRHLPLILDINNNSRYINIGDWIFSFTYGEFSDNEMQIKKFVD